jgi:hypothetical protein
MLISIFLETQYMNNLQNQSIPQLFTKKSCGESESNREIIMFMRCHIAKKTHYKLPTTLNHPYDPPYKRNMHV